MKYMDPESITETTRWKIVTDKETFEKLKADQAFWSIVALGRAVNALLFVHQALVAHEGDDSPAALRARYNSVLFSCAIFFESSSLVQGMGKHFSGMPEFRKLSTVVSGKDARRVLDSGISVLRNTAVFHFDAEEIGRQLQYLELPEPIFVSAMGRTNGQVYCELADLCAFRTLYGPSFPASDVALAQSDFTRVTSNLIVEFSNVAQELIVAFLDSKGWHGEVLPEATQKSSADDPEASQSSPK